MLKLVLTFLAFAISISAENGTNCPEIKTRSKWEAQSPITVDYQTLPVPYVIIHHTVSSNCSTFRTCATQMKNIQHYHQVTKKWPDIAYNFLIGNDGNVYEGVGWHKIGTHTGDYNNRSIGIAFIGDFNDQLPTQQAIRAAKDLMRCGVEIGELDKCYKLVGARQLKQTQSPGITLYAEIQDWDNWVRHP